MIRSVKNIYHLGVKELVSLFRDYLLLILIIYSFSVAVVVASRGKPDSLSSAAIAVVVRQRIDNIRVRNLFITDYIACLRLALRFARTFITISNINTTAKIMVESGRNSGVRPPFRASA